MRKVVVFGASGNQGRFAIQSLLGSVPPKFNVVAFTRNKASPKSQSLQEMVGKSGNFSFFEGDMDSENSIYHVLKKCFGVFLVLPESGEDTSDASEFVRAKRVIDASEKEQIQHLVVTTSIGVDRGSGTFFENKRKIEEYLMGKSAFGYTILRPVFFMDNFNHESYQKKIMESSYFLDNFDLDFKLDMISCFDIGQMVARIMDNPTNPLWYNQCLEIAGHTITMREVTDILSQKLNKKIDYKKVPIEFDLTLLNIQKKHNKLLDMCFMSFEQWCEKYFANKK